MNEAQRDFVAAFLTQGPGFLNATGAARAAGYAWPNKQGPRLLTRPAVRAAVEAGFARLREEARACR